MISETSSDEDLLQCIREHDEEALQELMRRYYSRLGNFAYTLLHRRDLAEEAVLNVFLSVWSRRSTLVVRTKLRSYLFAAVGNQSFNLRKSQLLPVTLWLDDPTSPQLADADSSDSNILRLELQQEIDALIGRMPPQRQLIFRMNRIEGLRYWEIAQNMGIAESTVQNHMVQAVKQLAQELPKLRSTLGRNSTTPPFG